MSGEEGGKRQGRNEGSAKALGQDLQGEFENQQASGCGWRGVSLDGTGR